MAKSDNWQTPPDLIKVLDDEFHFTLEVCAAADNRALPHIPYAGLDNGFDALKVEWGMKEDVCYCNPPYSMLKEFIERAVDQCFDTGRTGVLLIPAYTDTKAWENIFNWSSEIRFLAGRLRFWENGAPGKDTARFPSAVIVFRPYKGFQPNSPHIVRWNWRNS